MLQLPHQDQILEDLRRHLVDGQLPCAAAHTVAQLWGVAPSAVGDLATAEGLRISLCQLGLFGYGPKSEGRSKLVRVAVLTPPALVTKLAQAANDGKITCAHCWQAAAELGVERLAVAEVAEAQRIKIVRCQLGCF